MQSTVKDKTWEKITEKIEGAGELLSKKKTLLERIRKVEDEKGTVPKKIYEKVRDEYDRTLKELDKELLPLEKDARQAREEVEAEIKELDTVINATRDQITEVEFRHRVGEYDNETMDLKAKPLKEKFSELSSSKEDLLKTFEKFDILFDNFRDLENTQSNIPEANSSSLNEDIEKSGDEGLSGQEGSVAEERSSSEPRGIGPERRAKTGKIERTADKKDPAEKEFIMEDPLAELADPFFDDSYDSSLDKRANEQEGPTQFNTAKGTPMLRILKGSGKDKIIPVLPITMTVGREHDNNIELKDEDVSRYHARIVHENGKYVLETLENTTGTWLNGKKTTRSDLKDSDIIRIGQTELSFEWK